ncbi:hypothetical protein HHI36_001218 [Cryptolaemus montrouzieri]|uniref:Uncharacterized protein n=1 Tax=Cryptolaemus montrouzieri TaxID=559131 RepID=A0ABD2P7P0_9CUCU
MVKNNIEIADLAQDLIAKSEGHGHQDYIIFVFTTTNVTNNRTLNAFIKKLLPISKFTNLITIVNQKAPEDYQIINSIKKSVNQFLNQNINNGLTLLIGRDNRKTEIVKKIQVILIDCSYNTKQSELTVIHINIGVLNTLNIRLKKQELELLAEKSGADIVCLSEHWFLMLPWRCLPWKIFSLSHILRDAEVHKVEYVFIAENR